ncbi:hypothetical protein ABTN34_17200, partial [Acinetobacter baumannii]
PDRNAGLLLVVQVLFSAMGLFVIDAVPGSWRLDAVYVFMLAWTLPCIVLAWRNYPEDPGERSQAMPLDWTRLLLGRGGAVVVGAGLYFLMIG